MSDMQNPAPVNPLPPAVVALVLVIIGSRDGDLYPGMRAALSAARGHRLAVGCDAVLRVLGRYLGLDVGERSQWPAEHLIRFVSYIFVHVAFTQALFVCVFVLAMGKMVGEVMGDLAMVLIFVLSGHRSGALGYGLLVNGACAADRRVSGGVRSDRRVYFSAVAVAVALVGAQQSRAFTLIAFLMGIQLLFGLLFGGYQGLGCRSVRLCHRVRLCRSFLAPGGWTSIRNRIRHD